MKTYTITFQNETSAQKFYNLVTCCTINKNVVTVKLLYNPNKLKSENGDNVFLASHGIVSVL